MTCLDAAAVAAAEAVGMRPCELPRHDARMWIDTHCHLDAAEFDADRDAVAERARRASVSTIVLPAVDAQHFDTVRRLAHRHGGAYALGIHPLAVGAAADGDLERLEAALETHRDDPRLVAVGEIGLDAFVPGLDAERLERFCAAQLGLARRHALPVILHSRRAVDRVVKLVRRSAVPGGIAHAFNGSAQQAQALLDLGCRLGFGGAMTFERALRIRALATTLPLEAIVLETDAPDIPPQWLYRTAGERAEQGAARNEPAELPRIGAVLAGLRGLPVEALAEATTANARAALPRLA
jgi:TatD DNase family protein